MTRLPPDASKSHSAPSAPVPGGLPRGPIGWLAGLFSSVRLGIVLLTILFFYCSIGSAGLFYPTGLNIFKGENWHIEFVRQWRGIELTEFEWFHTWFFNALIALICANIVVTTVRRIRLNRTNLGVWMIHAGIIILCVGSVWYFGTKVEGDAPVVRRSVVIRWSKDPSARPAVLPVLPGNRLEVPAPGGVYVFQVADTNPAWPILAEADKGKKAYSVTVAVTRPDQQKYMRQMLAGFPQYTEDVIPGKGRFKKLAESNGETIFDKEIDMKLAYEPQDRFWIKDSSALYLRKAGDRDWVQRPIEGLPRYNDYVPSAEDVWAPPEDPRVPVEALNIAAAPQSENDPLRDAQVRVTGYLRYAVPQQSVVPTGGAQLFPVAELRFENVAMGSGQTLQLAALDPQRSSAVNGLVNFRWVNDQGALDQLKSSGERKLTIRVPALNVTQEFVIKPEDVDTSGAGPWRDVPGTEGAYSFRVRGAADNLSLPDGGQSGAASSVWILIVELKTPEKTFTRWVADDSERTRDVSDGAGDAQHGMSAPDQSVSTTYRPALLSPVTIVAGPGEIGLRAILTLEGPAREEPLAVGKPVQVNDQLQMTLNSWGTNGRIEERPAIVPVAQRDKDSDRAFSFSMIKLEITRAGKTATMWLPRHQYSFQDENHADPALSRWTPEVLTLDDGREVEVMFSRRSAPLPTRVALDDFILTSQVGGFEPGKMGSIRDWTSVLRFEDPSLPDGWTSGQTMSTNSPVEHKGMWYFQSFWDPPRGARFQGDTGSGGMNFTGLGVGNREGVYVQLAGCCVSVLGMMYAFYVKPILKRKAKDRALAEAAAAGRLAAERIAPHANGTRRGGAMVSRSERAGLLDPTEER